MVSLSDKMRRAFEKRHVQEVGWLTGREQLSLAEGRRDVPAKNELKQGIKRSVFEANLYYNFIRCFFENYVSGRVLNDYWFPGNGVVDTIFFQ
jgi:hypothetical protein